jgi:hypothetical protein
MNKQPAGKPAMQGSRSEGQITGVPNLLAVGDPSRAVVFHHHMEVG